MISFKSAGRMMMFDSLFTRMMTAEKMLAAAQGHIYTLNSPNREEPISCPLTPPRTFVTFCSPATAGAGRPRWPTRCCSLQRHRQPQGVGRRRLQLQRLREGGEGAQALDLTRRSCTRTTTASGSTSIDAPGSPDLIGRRSPACRRSRRWRSSSTRKRHRSRHPPHDGGGQGRKPPRAIIVNKFDSPDVDLEALVEQHPRDVRPGVPADQPARPAAAKPSSNACSTTTAKATSTPSSAATPPSSTRSSRWTRT